MIRVINDNRVSTLVLSRPEKRNALNDEMAKAILEQLQLLKSDDTCQVLVIKGEGEAFCAGADLGYLQKLQSNSYEENLADSTALMTMFKALYEFPKITIAQVEGPALAGGCGLAGLCDFVYATPNASFGYTEVKIGFIPAIVSVFLAPKIGENAAKAMLLTGKIFNASEAKEMQIVNEVCEPEVINEVVAKFANSLVKGVSSQSIELTKKLLLDIKGKSLDEQLTMAAAANAAARATEDCKAGINAFLNKEKIIW
jgi:methylglutaconyl-CoA hydratase